MKRFLLLFVCLVTFSVASFADDGRPVSFNQLPVKAQTFVKHNFRYADVQRVVRDDDEFEVVLKGGVKIEFAKNGHWTEIEAKRKGVPARIIPERIKTYVHKCYGAHVRVMEISREDHEMEVKLSNGKELKFDRNSRTVEVDD